MVCLPAYHAMMSWQHKLVQQAGMMQDACCNEVEIAVEEDNAPVHLCTYSRAVGQL